jgi:hypothetical protein
VGDEPEAGHLSAVGIDEPEQSVRAFPSAFLLLHGKVEFAGPFADETERLFRPIPPLSPQA